MGCNSNWSGMMQIVARRLQWIIDAWCKRVWNRIKTTYFFFLSPFPPPDSSVWYCGIPPLYPPLRESSVAPVAMETVGVVDWLATGLRFISVPTLNFWLCWIHQADVSYFLLHYYFRSPSDDFTHQSGLLILALRDEPPRRLRHEDKPYELYEGRDGRQTQHVPEKQECIKIKYCRQCSIGNGVFTLNGSGTGTGDGNKWVV